MANDSPLSAEASSSKVAAVFDAAAAAHAAVSQLRAQLGLSEAQVQLIAPTDIAIGRKLEPESRGVLRTLVRTHIWMGLGGAAAGAAVSGILMARGVPMVVNSAALATVIMATIGTMGGLMLGGLLTLRPDHDVVINKVHDAIEQGRYSVVVHPVSADQRAQAVSALQAAGGNVASTL